MATEKKKDPFRIPGLAAVLEAVDRDVRTSAVRAHERVIQQIALIKEREIGGVKIPAEALVPRDIFEARRVGMEFEVQVTKNGVTFSKGFMQCGSTFRIKMEWEAVAAPESTALVRTKAEATLAADIKHG